jgi:hypothetical protein
MSALREKRRELAGEFAELEKHAAQKRVDIPHVNAVLRLYDPRAEKGARSRRLGASAECSGNWPMRAN